MGPVHKKTIPPRRALPEPFSFGSEHPVLAGWRLAQRPPTKHQHLSDGLLYGELRRVQQVGVGALLQRRNSAPRVLGITLVDVLQKGVKVSMYSFVDQLFIAAPRTLLWTGGQEYLEGGVGEHHGAHIAPVRHQPRRPAEGALAAE